ncbi:type IX secretion/gliding motility protein PorT/SprT [Pedobacter sp. MW01-1-1]|uniref:type IX secretion/gliding motility protein PorT/SprT n=1 Tax=Pedobacter sp. MW01-1-1 TaxID=3383027 RepID=UPI003FF03DB8
MIKKVSFLSIILLLSVGTFAQNWGGGVDDDDWTWGFNFQYISGEYKILKKANWRDRYLDPQDGNPVTSIPTAIYSQPTQGFGLGFIINRNISDNLDFRVTPSLIFSDRIISYEYEPQGPIVLNNGQIKSFSNVIDKKVQATMFEFPMGIKVKSDRMNNFRAYWIGGAKFSMDIASKKKTFDDDAAPLDKFVKNKRNYLSYETGIGCDFYFEYFKMSPEIKLSYSTSDVLVHDDTPFANPIEKLMLRQLTFSLIFQ